MYVRTICHLQAAWETRDFAIATAHGSRHVRCKSEDAAAVGSTGIEKCNKFIRAQGVTVKSPFKGRFSFWGRNPKSKKLVGTGFPTFVDSYPGSHIYMYICIYVYMIYVYVYMYICIYVYMYICIYVYMYICICLCIYDI